MADPKSRLTEALEAVQEHVSEEKSWTTDELWVDFAESFSSEKTQKINVMKHIGFQVRLTDKIKDGMKKYWLPAKFNKIDKEGRQEVASHFSNASLNEGFAIRIKSYVSNKKQLRLYCTRGRYYKSATKPNSEVETELEQETKQEKAYPNRVATTQKPIKGEGETCPFLFSVYWNEDFKRWYIPEKQPGCANHTGHIRLTRDIAPARKEDMPEDELAIAMDCIDSKMKASALDKLIMKRNGISLTTGRLEYLKKIQKDITSNRCISANLGNGKLVNPQTPADRLLAHFDADEKSSYVALYAEFDSQNITIRKKCKYRQDHSIADVNPNECSDDVESALSDAKKHRRSILKSLSVSSEVNKILLAFAWTDDESKLRFDMFPEVMGGDCVSKMNREERQVMHWTGLDSNNKAFTHTWVFMPSEANWTFQWVVTNVIPHLHNRETLEKVQLVLTDQDGQLNDVITQNTGPGTVLPNAKHRLCAWHKLDRNLTNKSSFSSLVSSGQMKQASNKSEWNAIVTWLWSLVKTPETEAEANLMLTLLDCYLQERTEAHRGFLSHALLTKLRDFVANNFQSRETKLFAHNFFDYMGLDKITTSFVEAENSAAKRHAYAPGPRDSLDTAQLKMEERTAQRNRQRRKQAAVFQVSQPSSVDDRDTTVLELTKYSSDFLWEQYKEHTNYCCWSVTPFKCFVKRKPITPPNLSETEGMPYDVQRSIRKKFVVPKLERTRTVTLELDESIAQWTLKCTCGTFTAMGMTCRHVMAVTGQKPAKLDARYRWWRDYNLLFLPELLSDETRKKIVKADTLSRRTNGSPTELTQLPRHRSDMSREWFEETIGNFTIQKIGYWNTACGQTLIELAKFQVASYLGHGLRPFGTIQEVQTSSASLLGLPKEDLEEDSVAPSPNTTPTETLLDPCVLEMSQPMPDLDGELKSESIKGMLRKGAYSSFHPLFSKMSTIANNPTRISIMWKCLQHTHQLLMDDIRKEQSQQKQSTANSTTMVSDPNASGRKRSNARTKRIQDLFHTKKKPKKDKDNP